jgi:hypothetical protein
MDIQVECGAVSIFRRRGRFSSAPVAEPAGGELQGNPIA